MIKMNLIISPLNFSSAEIFLVHAFNLLYQTSGIPFTAREQPDAACARQENQSRARFTDPN